MQEHPTVRMKVSNSAGSGVGVRGFRLVTQCVECLPCIYALSLISSISRGEAGTECDSQVTVLFLRLEVQGLPERGPVAQ